MNGRVRLFFLSMFAILVSTLAVGQSGGELRFCLRSEPKTFNPLLVQDDSSETIRYLTGGVLVRINRLTQVLEPELATAWKVSKDGRSVRLATLDVTSEFSLLAGSRRRACPRFGSSVDSTRRSNRCWRAVTIR